MIDYDVTVTWLRNDGSTVNLPATVCYRDDRDDPQRRGESMAAAIEANLIDFPDDLGTGAVPVRVAVS